ncbi:spore coat protein [Clostridium sp. YIM B02505]|uniref:Spore coat protein n=1 Tax=Clostridium yunnanense TaxID=2800325 RepID=A0ABS1EP46_9CLOT|nr:spore coat protein [Clostridium yunnanense]MBK1811130.1 spore coat protein [Clostridium yunnanense]
MNEQFITPHETLQLHELLTLKNLSLTKAITMSPLVEDIELKSIMKESVSAEQVQIGELRAYMEQSYVAKYNQ